MDPERWRQIDRLLEHALELPPEDRAAFLDTTCDGDPTLRQAVEKLLQAHGQADNLFGASAFEMTALFASIYFDVTTVCKTSRLKSPADVFR